jgi:hypothetical protein
MRFVFVLLAASACHQSALEPDCTRVCATDDN